MDVHDGSLAFIPHDDDSKNALIVRSAKKATGSSYSGSLHLPSETTEVKMRKVLPKAPRQASEIESHVSLLRGLAMKVLNPSLSVEDTHLPQNEKVTQLAKRTIHYLEETDKPIEVAIQESTHFLVDHSRPLLEKELQRLQDSALPGALAKANQSLDPKAKGDALKKHQMLEKREKALKEVLTEIDKREPDKELVKKITTLLKGQIPEVEKVPESKKPKESPTLEKVDFPIPFHFESTSKNSFSNQSTILKLLEGSYLRSPLRELRDRAQSGLEDDQLHSFYEDVLKAYPSSSLLAQYLQKSWNPPLDHLSKQKWVDDCLFIAVLSEVYLKDLNPESIDLLKTDFQEVFRSTWEHGQRANRLFIFDLLFREVLPNLTASKDTYLEKRELFQQKKSKALFHLVEQVLISKGVSPKVLDDLFNLVKKDFDYGPTQSAILHSLLEILAAPVFVKDFTEGSMNVALIESYLKKIMDEISQGSKIPIARAFSSWKALIRIDPSTVQEEGKAQEIFSRRIQTLLGLEDSYLSSFERAFLQSRDPSAIFRFISSLNIALSRSGDSKEDEVKRSLLEIVKLECEGKFTTGRIYKTPLSPQMQKLLDEWKEGAKMRLGDLIDDADPEMADFTVEISSNFIDILLMGEDTPSCHKLENPETSLDVFDVLVNPAKKLLLVKNKDGVPVFRMNLRLKRLETENPVIEIRQVNSEDPRYQRIDPKASAAMYNLVNSFAGKHGLTSQFGIG